MKDLKTKFDAAVDRADREMRNATFAALALAAAALAIILTLSA